MPRVHILMTWLNEGLKVKESEIIRTKSNFIFLQELKPEFSLITEIKRGIYPKMI